MSSRGSWIVRRSLIYSYRNGTTSTTASTAAVGSVSTSTVLWVGQWGGGSFFFPGTIGAMLFYNRALTPGEEACNRRYLKGLWSARGVSI